MTDLSADLAQQKQKLRERLRFRQHIGFAANLDGMAQLAAFRALPAPLVERLANHAVVGAYVAHGDEPDVLPMFADLAAAGALALPHHAGRVAEMDFRRWRPGELLVTGPWGTQQPDGDAPFSIRRSPTTTVTCRHRPFQGQMPSPLPGSSFAETSRASE